jgi:hypothetical protein
VESSTDILTLKHIKGDDNTADNKIQRIKYLKMITNKMNAED